jgi:hypothetical protein
VKKTMWGNTVAIYSVLKRKKNYKTKFSTNSILKKNQQKRFWKKKHKKMEKKHVEKVKAKFSTRSILKK